MVRSPRKASVKTSVYTPPKTAKVHKQVTLKRTRTMKDTVKEGRAYVAAFDKKKEGKKSPRIVKKNTPSPKKSPVKAVVPVQPVDPAPAPVKRTPAKAKTPKRHVKVKAKHVRTKTMNATLEAAKAFLGKKDEAKKAESPKKYVKVKAKHVRTKTMNATLEAAKAFLGKKDEAKKEESPKKPSPKKPSPKKPKGKLARTSTIQQAVNDAQSYLGKGRKSRR